MNRSLSNRERQMQVLQYIEASEQASVANICERFQISEATARRDLEALAEQGKIDRIHGGAVARQKAPPELPVYQRMNEQSGAKERIAAAAAKLVKDGETIFLGSGTTTYEVARRLVDRKNLTVITNSLLISNLFLECANIYLIVLGGIFRRSELSLIGHLTEQSLSDLRADKVIIGIHGIDAEHGLTNDYLQETMTDRKILQIGKENIIVADHTKCGRLSTAFVAPLTSVHTLVTDDETPAEFIEEIIARGVRVIQT